MRQIWDVKEIVLENKSTFEAVAENLKVNLIELGEDRYIVCLNEKEAKRDQAVREEIVSELREKITKGPKKMIGNTGYRRYLSVDKDAVQIDEKKIASEKKFDGICVLRTNTDLSAKDAALAYKGLWQVERAFRDIKSTFEIRPVYLSREDRIKGHIAVCFSVFCLQVTFLRIVRGEEKLKELSVLAMLQDVSEIRMIHLEAEEAECRILTELSTTANAIFQAADVSVPRRASTAHYLRTTSGNAVVRSKTAKIVADKSTACKTLCQRLVNTKIRVIQRRAYRLRDEEYLRLKVLT